MKKYETNSELIEILTRNGFIETTTNFERRNSKKSFRIAKQSKKSIYFDNTILTIINSPHICDSRIKLTETELKSLLLYFKLKQTDINELFESKQFKFNIAENRILALKKELILLKDLGIINVRQKKIARIVETFDNITID